MFARETCEVSRACFIHLAFRVFREICVPHRPKVSKNWTLFIEKSIFRIFSCDGACMFR